MKLLLLPPPAAIIIQNLNFNFLKANGWELLSVFETAHIKGYLRTTSFHLTIIRQLLSQPNCGISEATADPCGG
jgi:hypothetical protein